MAVTTCSKQYFYTENSHSYNLRLNYQFSRPLFRSVFHRSKSIFYLGPVIWDILPDSYKNLSTLVFLKTRLKSGNPKIVPGDLAQHTFLESTLNRLSLW